MGLNGNKAWKRRDRLVSTTSEEVHGPKRNNNLLGNHYWTVSTTSEEVHGPKQVTAV